MILRQFGKANICKVIYQAKVANVGSYACCRRGAEHEHPSITTKPLYFASALQGILDTWAISAETIELSATT